MDDKLTVPQDLALDLNRHVAVTAGAGSGKTQVLTRRYIRALEEDPDLGPVNILAITFTRKAAAEMKERIRKDVRELAETSRGEEVDRWERVIDEFDRMEIGTIHSFCSSLLRKFPMEAGVSPDFSVIEEDEGGFLLRETIDETLREMSDRGDGDLSTLARHWPRKTIEDTLTELVEGREEFTPCLEWLDSSTVEEITEERRSILKSMVGERLEEVFEREAWKNEKDRLRSLLETASSVPAEDNLFERLRKIVDLVNKIETLEDVFEKQRLCRELAEECLLRSDGEPLKFGMGRKGNWGGDAPEKETVREVCQDFAEFFYRAEDVFKHSFTDFDSDSSTLLKALARVFSEVSEAYRGEKTDRNVLDFQDLESRARDLLKSGRVREEIGEKYDYILVDEFQDTNRIQWDIIESVAREEDGSFGTNVFLVGDEKQSIYRFRGADVTVFGEVRDQLRRENKGVEESFDFINKDNEGHLEEYGEHLEEAREGIVHMDESFRPLPEILDSLNIIFENIFPAPEESKPYEAAHQELTSRRDDDGKGGIDLILSQEDEDEVFEGVEWEAELVARRVKQIIGDLEVYSMSSDFEEKESCKPEDVTILLSRRTKLTAFEEALNRNNVPFTVISGTGFYQQQEVLDTLNLLKFLTDPDRQDIPLFGVLRSPLFGLSDDALYWIRKEDGKTAWEQLRNTSDNPEPYSERDSEVLEFAEEKLAEWMGEVDSIPVAELLQKVYGETGAWTAYRGGKEGKKATKNLKKLLKFARDFESEGYRTVRDFVHELDFRAEESPREGQAELTEEPGVKIMTIHQAKGLQFPVVVVPELDHSFRVSSGRVMMDTYESRPLIGAKVRDMQENEYEEDCLYGFIKDMERRKELAEHQRLFYVACTRARDRLILSAKPEADNGGFGDPEDPPKTWWDMVLPVVDPKVEDEKLDLNDELKENGFRIERGIRRPDVEENRDELLFERLEDGSLPTGSPALVMDIEEKLDSIDREERESEFGVSQLSDLLRPTATHRSEGKVLFSSGAEGKIVGSTVHGVLSREEFKDLERAVEEKLVKGKVFEPTKREKLKNQIAETLEAVYRDEFFRKLEDGGPDFRELNVYHSAGNVSYRGVLDRLTYLEGDDEWYLVDYKTDKEIDSLEEAVVEKGYDLQITLYALSLIDSDMEISEENLRGFIYFTSPQKHVEVNLGDKIEEVKKKLKNLDM